MLQLGEIQVDQPGEVLLEGLGRALTVFPPIERGLESATPDTMQLTPAEAFVLVRTAARQLRDAGVGLSCRPASPAAWPADWACRSRPNFQSAPAASPWANVLTGSGI